ncbi:MAG: DUF2306 domain-containing protein [Pirellulaceae bacterium]
MYLFRKWPLVAFWSLVTVLLCVLIVWNTRLYFLPGVTAGFLMEKGDIANLPIWRAAFYFHIFGACVCLVCGCVLFFPRLIRYRRLHKVLGYIYFNSVLWIAAPAGLILAPFAKHGWLSAFGFLVTGVAWWLTTWAGYRAIRIRDIQTHIRWMVRSWCIALSAVFFRLFQAALYFAGMDDASNYIVSVWASLAASIALAEICIGLNMSWRRNSGLLPGGEGGRRPDEGRQLAPAHRIVRPIFGPHPPLRGDLSPRERW